MIVDAPPLQELPLGRRRLSVDAAPPPRGKIPPVPPVVVVVSALVLVVHVQP